MKKGNNNGFMLAETLIVTTIVAGVLIFLFIQFSRLNNSYNDYYDYNSTEKLYALEDIKTYIQNDEIVISIPDLIEENGYMDISDCKIFSDQDYCLKLFEFENINKIYIVNSSILSSNPNMEDIDTLNFFNKIKNNNTIYILIGKFNDGSYASFNLDKIIGNNN